MMWLYAYAAVAVLIVVTDGLYGWYETDEGDSAVVLAVFWPIALCLLPVLPFVGLALLHDKLKSEWTTETDG